MIQQVFGGVGEEHFAALQDVAAVGDGQAMSAFPNQRSSLPWIQGRDSRRHVSYNEGVIRIRFDNQEAKRKALAYLPGRFSFKSWASGEMLVPEVALADLAVEGIEFIVEGPAT